jgi:hypothetical protein
LREKNDRNPWTHLPCFFDPLLLIANPNPTAFPPNTPGGGVQLLRRLLLPVAAPGGPHAIRWLPIRLPVSVAYCCTPFPHHPLLLLSYCCPVCCLTCVLMWQLHRGHGGIQRFPHRVLRGALRRQRLRPRRVLYVLSFPPFSLFLFCSFSAHSCSAPPPDPAHTSHIHVRPVG